MEVIKNPIYDQFLSIDKEYFLEICFIENDKFCFSSMNNAL